MSRFAVMDPFTGEWVETTEVAIRMGLSLIDADRKPAGPSISMSGQPYWSESPLSLREALEEVTDVGIYPAATPSGPRTPFQEGWNAAVISIGDAVDKFWEQQNDHPALFCPVWKAAQPILDRCLDFFNEDDLDPESSFAMPVTLKARDVYQLREVIYSKEEAE